MPIPHCLSRVTRFSRALRLAGASWLGLASPGAAEPPPAACPPTVSGFAPVGAPAPEKPPRPATGAGSVAAFVEGLSSTDAAFEVVLGQGRILTLKKDLAVPGQPAPLIAIGDPTVIDFAVL